jgi:DNA invertase Pin-like site-specific DNA recombinase
MQKAVRDALVSFMAATAEAQAEATREAQKAGIAHAKATEPHGYRAESRASIGALAFANKTVVYDLLFRAAADTLTTIAADPKHLGARIGFTAVLHTWGSALTHHPHVHVIVPGGGLSPDGSRWIT